MEKLLPIVAGLIGLFVVWKALKGAVKIVGIVIVLALVAALYFGAV